MGGADDISFVVNNDGIFIDFSIERHMFQIKNAVKNYVSLIKTKMKEKSYRRKNYLRFLSGFSF